VWPFRLARVIRGGLPLLTKRRRSQHAVSHVSGARENGGLRMKCAECGTRANRAAQACAVCGTPAAGPPSLVAGEPGAPPAGARSGSARFSTTRLRPGYDMEQVDAFLDAVQDTFLGVRQPPLTAEEIRAKQFAVTRLRPGYDEEEVDAFLDDAEARLRARCAECGAETGGAVEACVVCGAPVVTRPSAAVDPIPETCLSCGTVTAEHLPGCPAEAAVKRARRWRVAAVLALLATGALLAVVGKLDHLHGRWVVAAGWVIAGCGLTLAVVEKTAEERGRGPLLPKWLRVVTPVLLVYGFALLITQSHGGGGGGAG